MSKVDYLLYRQGFLHSIASIIIKCLQQIANWAKYLSKRFRISSLKLQTSSCNIISNAIFLSRQQSQHSSVIDIYIKLTFHIIIYTSKFSIVAQKSFTTLRFSC